MELGLVSCVWGDYWKFIPQFAEYAAAMDPRPSQVTISMQGGTIYDYRALLAAESVFPGLQIVTVRDLDQTLGGHLNVGIKYTDTEWISTIGIDDHLVPNAIDLFSRHEDSDLISIGWQSNKPGSKYRKAYRPGYGYVSDSSPFRRNLWERFPYAAHNYPHGVAFADYVCSGARVAILDQICLLADYREDSLSARLGNRSISNQGPDRKFARELDRKARMRIKAYYGHRRR